MQMWPLIDDGLAPTVFFDGIARAEAHNGILRVVLCYGRKNPATGTGERLICGTLLRPTAVTLQINRAIALALTGTEQQMGALLN